MPLGVLATASSEVPIHRTLILALTCLLATSAAAVPLELSHQGRLADSTGVALEGDHTLTFSLYDSATATDAFWTEDHTTSLDAGYFSVILGSQGSAIDTESFAGDSVFLGISVDGDAELPDRLPLLSVPYALRADVASAVSGGPIDATEIKVGGNVVVDSSGGISFASLTGVPDDSDTLAAITGCTDGDVATYSGTEWTCSAPSAAGTVDVSTLDGTINIANLPVGADSDKVAAGDHTHTASEVGALPITGGTLTGGLTGTTASFSGTVSGASASFDGGVGLGDSTAECDSSTAGTLRFTGDALLICANDSWSQVWPDSVGTQALPAASCAAIIADQPSADSGVYWLDPQGNGASFQAYCDMETDGGGWTMCYSSDNDDNVLMSSQFAYSADKPYGANGYRSDCRNIPFAEVLYIDHDDDQKAWFSRDNQTRQTAASIGWNAAGSVAGLWTGHGDARTTWKYQLNVCSAGWMPVGLMMSGYTSCYKQCGSWCGDTTTDYYRIDGDDRDNNYNGIAFRQNGHTNVAFQLMSVGIR